MDAAGCETALYRLLQSTLRVESIVTLRDAEISKVNQRFAHRLESETTTVEKLEAELEAFYRLNQAEIEANGQKSLQMAHGTMGIRVASSPALVPLTDSWTWEAITTKVLTVWKRRFILPVRPALDKVKLKKLLTAGELKPLGLRLDAEGKFYVNLNRLGEKSQVAA